MYMAVATRPDISYSINKDRQFLNNFTKIHGVHFNEFRNN